MPLAWKAAGALEICTVCSLWSLFPQRAGLPRPGLRPRSHLHTWSLDRELLTGRATLAPAGHNSWHRICAQHTFVTE